MSFEEILTGLAQEGTLGVCWLIGNDQQIHYTYGEWDVNPVLAFQAWKNQSGSIMLGGIKYTVLDMNQERLIASNLGGDNGHILVAKCHKWDGVVVAWAPQQVPKDYAYASTARLAAKVG